MLRHQLKVAKPPKAPQTGAKREREAVIVVSSAKSSSLNSFAELTTPAAPFGTDPFLFMARPPLLSFLLMLRRLCGARRTNA